MLFQPQTTIARFPQSLHLECSDSPLPSFFVSKPCERSPTLPFARHPSLPWQILGALWSRGRSSRSRVLRSDSDRFRSLPESECESCRFRFTVATLPRYVASGEVRFLMEWDRTHDEVEHRILAFSFTAYFDSDWFPQIKKDLVVKRLQRLCARPTIVPCDTLWPAPSIG